MGVASHSDADMVLRVKDADLQDDTDATLSWNSENSSGSSTPRTPRSKNASTFKNGGGRVSQVIGTTSPALLFSIIVCVSVLSVLSVLAYTNITPASLQELHETVTAKKLLWWDAWYHGRVTEEQIKSLPKQCLDYRLSVYHSVTNRIVADDTEKSYAPVNLSTSEAYPNKGRIPATSELSMDDAIPKNIYFLHFNPVFTMYRYVCSIESAARLNPNHIITVFAKNVTDLDRTLDKWRAVVGDQMGSRVKVKRIDYTTYFQETPLEPWWKEGRWRQSHWVGQNLGNALRLAIVYKEGGVYLDMDIISLNPLDNIGRSIAREEQDRINNAAISFPRRDPLVWALMEEFLDGWNGWLW
ncbi:nucleotide-diphospho-sugar transferase [Powellomyces hirtus]|nr:nucleotide-diphospho-sugar transferase [Powellomyces hirtus]